MTGPIESQLEILPDREALARRAADWLVEIALAARVVFRISLSGGSTPQRLYELLAEPPYRDVFPWARVHCFWGDERFVPKSDARSNYRMVYEALLSRVPIPPTNVHPIPTEGMTPAEAALAYERTLQSHYGALELDPARPLFDVTLLGLGQDGHIASLFPGSKELLERTRWVVAVMGVTPEPRISLTRPVLGSGRHVAFLVAGREKQAILERVRAGGRALPAAQLETTGTVRWFADAEAAGAVT